MLRHYYYVFFYMAAINTNTERNDAKITFLKNMIKAKIRAVPRNNPEKRQRKKKERTLAYHESYNNCN